MIFVFDYPSFNTQKPQAVTLVLYSGGFFDLKRACGKRPMIISYFTVQKQRESLGTPSTKSRHFTFYLNLQTL